ncbi:MAG: alkaline phosphatase D family protein [Pseudomonadota bacterium]
MLITRRNTVFAGLAGGTAACVSKPELGRFSSAGSSANTAFSCGIASGDPAADSVVLWTRVEGNNSGRIPVDVEVAEDATFARVVWQQRSETGPERDYTVKVVADGLEPGRQYAYRFRALGATSPIGKTKTLPEETERVRFAVVSCSNYNFGYFNAYDHIARDADFDAVIHLGDYFYEYGPDGYGGEAGIAVGRPHDPARETLTLDDYRRRHRQYKRDGAAQRMHAAHGMIAIWDDHETSNDSFKDGAENHQPTSEGDWAGRKRAAMQAYYEYMPVREPEPGRLREQLFRSYSWGRFLTLPIIESRLTARDHPVAYDQYLPQLTGPEALENFVRDVLGDPSRELLGAEQLAYVEEALETSVARGDTWRVIGNQVMMARVKSPDLLPFLTEEQIQEFEVGFPQIRGFLAIGQLGLPLNTDAWDGYPAARERFYAKAQAAGARDLVVITGDTHQFWANDLVTEDGTKMGVELGTAGVTSPGASAYLGEAAFDVTLLLRRDNPDVRYTDAYSKGYISLEFNQDKARSEFISMSTIASPDYTAIRSASFDLEQKDGSVSFERFQGLGFKERVLFGRSA